MVNHMLLYTCKEEDFMKDKIKNLTEAVKELQKLITELEKLLIKVISIVGWIYIFIQLFK